MINLNINHGGKISTRKRHPKIKRNCLNCKKEFETWQSESRRGKGKFCSTSCGKSGINAWNWKGGVRNVNGYIWLKKPNHPGADLKGYVSEHRLVMEAYLGRYLTKKEIVHHKNRIRNDNRIENLELIENQSRHYIEHMTGNKIWLGKKHKLETIEKMKKNWTKERKEKQSKEFKGQGNPNYKDGKYIT